jgi:zinc-binding alcohol dehydrogenase family protein
MKAIGLYRHLPISDPESLIDLEVEKPNPAGHDLLVSVKAVSVNPVDVKRRANGNDENPARIIGWDAAGIVEAVGSDVTLFKPGDEVYYAGDITRPGSNSEFQLIDERIVGRKPSSLGFAEAAALPLTTLTAWEGLFDRMEISHQPEKNKGKKVLIIGAAGGVGSIATQLASLAGLTVISTASRPESIKWTLEHGSDFTINHHEPFMPQLQQLGFKHVEYVFCLNTPDTHWEQMLEVVAPQGKICSILGLQKLPSLTDVSPKSVTLVWEYMYTRSMYQTADMIEQHHILDEVANLIDNGTLKTTLTCRLSPINAQNLRTAHTMVEKGSMIGKVVLENFA